MIKAIIKIFLLILFLLMLAYFVGAYIEGGFGERQESALATKYAGSQVLFAHRGVVDKHPENSREAIALAKKKGFRGLEVDIRKSADGEFIVFHDENCSRLLGLNANVEDLTTAQIKKFKLLINKDTSASTVLTLNEMLDEFKNDFIFYFDLKLKNVIDADELVHLIETYDLSQSVIIASTSAPVVLHLEYHYPAIITALEGLDAGKEWMYFLIPKNLKPDFISGFASKVNEKHISWLKEKKLLNSRIIYGVDSSNYQQVVDLGIKNMILDYYPELVIP
jgi:glycerophosphoryl diester phosphodiesterase